MRQIFTEKELNALLDMVTIREMSNPVRKAVRLRIINGHSLDLASAICGVSKSTVINAIKRIIELEKKVVSYNDIRCSGRNNLNHYGSE